MEQEMKQKRTPKKMVIAGIIAVVALIIAAVIHFTGQQYESTDNAQLDGDLFSIRADVTGFAKELRFTDNQKVKKGDTLIIFDTEELNAKVLQAQAALNNALANLNVSQNNAS